MDSAKNNIPFYALVGAMPTSRLKTAVSRDEYPEGIKASLPQASAGRVL
jgi:hypothetical protein